MIVKFDYMNFEGGEDTEFVIHAKKFTKQQAVELFVQENVNEFTNLRTPNLLDIIERQVRYFVKTPEWCGYDDTKGGCYTYCKDRSKGSFPVWVIKFKNLRTK